MEVRTDPDYAVLRVGFARTEITPGPDCSLMGFQFRSDALPEGNAGVHDPLYVRAMAFREHKKLALLISFDLAGIPLECAGSMRKAIADAASTTPDHVILSCTHTHSGPFLLTPQMARKAKKMRSRAAWPEVAYTKALLGKAIDAARRAEGLTYPVDVYLRQAPLGMAYCRRARTEDGIAHCWEPQQFPHRQPDPPADPTCSVLVFRQRGGPRSYVLWSAGAHPVVLGATSRAVSADYPGAACDLIEEWVPGARAMFILDAAGDAHPWIATQEDPANIAPVARAAASFVSLLANAGRPIAIDQPPFFRCLSESVKVGRKVDLTVWRMGPIRIVAHPFEMFSALAADVRRRMDGPVLISTVSNGLAGYLPTRQAFEEGGYEVNGAKHAKLKPGDGEKVVKKIVEMAEQLG